MAFMPHVDSTAIAQINYDAMSHDLDVTFTTGRIYSYFDVPRSVYTGFVNAPSHGEFFNRRIRDRYDFVERPPRWQR